MTEVFTDTLHSWQNCYFMIGGASAGLMGLMFVALSLGMGLANDAASTEISAFVTPSILYFVSALLVSSVMLVPTFTPPMLGGILVLGAGMGLARIMQHVWWLIQVAIKHRDFDYWNWLTQIIWPLLSYGLILLAGLGFVVGQWSLAFIGLWLATLMLLICAISNTWSLVIWIIEHRRS